MSTERMLTHIAGTFVIQADGAFLNGAGLGQGEDRTTTVPKTLLDNGIRVPYVSAQSWRRWLRNTLIEETGWEASEIRAIKFNPKGNTSKVSGEVNPIDFAEDDLFGYMRTAADEDEVEGDDEDETRETDKNKTKKARSGSRTKVKPVMRPSPFASSLLIAIRRSSIRSIDKGYVFPKFDGVPEPAIEHNVTPLPYSTEFYSGNMQAVFCLDYGRMGIFRNIGDRVELAEEFIKLNLQSNKIQITEDFGSKGRIYALTDITRRKVRAGELLKALAVLRGGAKQAQFGTSVSPQAIVAVGLTCGNPIFHHLFEDEVGHGLTLRVEVLKEIIAEYADRIVTPVYIGVRKGFLMNEGSVMTLLQGEGMPKVVITTPREAMTQLAEQLS